MKYSGYICVTCLQGYFFKKKQKHMSNESKSKSAFKRELVNTYLTYEQFIWYTSRYYSELQQTGQLDVVGLIMYVEGVSESDAIGRCIGILAEFQKQHANIIEVCRELLTVDPSLKYLSDQNKNN